MNLSPGSRGFQLLTIGNPKTEKGRGLGYWTFILHLAPADLSGYNVCPLATAGCKHACLNTAGRGGIHTSGILTYAQVKHGTHNAIQTARRRRTRAFFEHRADFMALLVKEVAKAIRLARSQGLIPVFRLNGTSDIRWESMPVGHHANIMAVFPDVQFYDYTKFYNRKHIPANYHLTFSLAENNEAHAALALDNGMNIAAVFRNKDVVARYLQDGMRLADKHVPCMRGDDTDLRFIDAPGHVVALFAKGNAKRDRTGFVRD